MIWEWVGRNRRAANFAVRRRAAAARAPGDRRSAGVVRRSAVDRALGGQSLRGYLTGSIDVVLRVPSGPRYLVVDYKTNWLGDPDRPLTAGRLRPAAAGGGDAALATTRCRRCCTALCCTASCAGGSPIRPRAPSRRRAVPVRARYVRAGHPGGRRPSGRGVQLAAAGSADRRRCPTCSMWAWRRCDDRKRAEP